LAQGFIVAFYAARSCCPTTMDANEDIKIWPKCLREDCELWIPEYLTIEGHCGYRQREPRDL